MSEPDESYYIKVQEDEWLNYYDIVGDEKVAFIKYKSDYETNGNYDSTSKTLSLPEEDTITKKKFVYMITSYTEIQELKIDDNNYIPLKKLIIPCLYTDVLKEIMWIIDYNYDSSKIIIENLQFVKNKLQTNGTFELKDTVSGTTKNEFNDQGEKHIYGLIYELNRRMVYQPFNTFENLSYENGLYIKQDVYYHNLKCLYVYNNLSIDNDKGLYVNDGDIVIRNNFVMNPRSTIQCKKLSF